MNEGDSPAHTEAVSLASPEPSALRRFLISVPAVYQSMWPITVVGGLGLIANVWFGGPFWASGLLVGVLGLPALFTALAGRVAGWYSDYRWAVAKADWPTALERARWLSGSLEDNLGKSLMARALAGLGEVDAARELMEQVTVCEGFPRMNYLLHSGFVLTEAGDYEAALKIQLAIFDETEDVPTAAQAVATCYAIYFQDGARARPYLEQAEGLRGRGEQVDFHLDATEVFVRVEEGEGSTVLPLLDKLLPLVEVYVATVPEMWHLKALLHAYACLASAETDPSRAAQHFAQAAPIITTRGPERLVERCEQALAA